MIDRPAELQAEQEYVDMLFARLDDEVTHARVRLEEVSLNIDPAHPKAEALLQRETEYHSLNERIDRLNLASLGLVFGRIEVEDPLGEGDNLLPVGEGEPQLDRRYIGRMGLDAREDNYRTLLLDWRAPMARPFYLATTARPEGVHRRRHIRMRGQKIRSIDDEVLIGSDQEAEDSRADIAGESALLTAVTQARTGRMATIVETIQREQDEIIRDPSRGVMVVDGGPGTGKTAVALHRVAYLLYTWRKQLARTGVLILGPNTTFLNYISHVLPELGETGVVLSTVADLYPGISPTTVEAPITREVKGSAEMAHILKRAVHCCQRLPHHPLELRIGSLTLEATPQMVKTARTRARRSHKPHNRARGVFREQLIELLAQQMAQRIGEDPLGGDNLLSRADVDQLHDDLEDESVVTELLDKLWPYLTPEGLLADLLSSREFIAQAAAEYDQETQDALYRQDGALWSTSDAALLDELAELLGPLGRNEADTQDDDEVEQAQKALDILRGSAVTDNDEYFDAEYLGAYDVIDAQTLAERQRERDGRNTAQRARADRNWAFGHVIVDEAQELSPMEWRAVFRRCPSRWMTLVGDTSQTSSPAGVDSWSDTLEPFVGTRLRTHTLTVNYRTPAAAMQLADAIDPAGRTSVAIREGEPVRRLPSGTLIDAAVSALPCDHRAVAMITATGAKLPEMPDNVAVYNPSSVKGLEFDHVIVVEPHEIVKASTQGWQDLYVVLTRCTQTLTIIGEMP